MDYLVSEGYPEAAAKFAAEANLSPRVDVDSINQRVEIRNLIHEGDIKTAIEKINDLNPQVSSPIRTLRYFRIHHCAMISFVHAPLIHTSWVTDESKTHTSVFSLSTLISQL